MSFGRISGVTYIIFLISDGEREWKNYHNTLLFCSIKFQLTFRLITFSLFVRGLILEIKEGQFNAYQNLQREIKNGFRR